MCRLEDGASDLLQGAPLAVAAAEEVGSANGETPGSARARGVSKQSTSNSLHAHMERMQALQRMGMHGRDGEGKEAAQEEQEEEEEENRST